jgi:hypothetical protein
MKPFQAEANDGMVFWCVRYMNEMTASHYMLWVNASRFPQIFSVFILPRVIRTATPPGKRKALLDGQSD